jgi:hypothetical protein
MTGARWTSTILGLWVALAGIIGFTPTFTLWDNLIAGVIIAGIGLSMTRRSASRGWITAVLGAWVLIAGFIPALEYGSALLWNNLVVGFAIAVAAVASSGHNFPQPMPHAQ